MRLFLYFTLPAVVCSAVAIWLTSLLMTGQPNGYPLDREMVTSIGINNVHVTLRTKVTRDGDTYVYHYNVKNGLKDKCFFHWGVLDQVVSDNGMSLLELAPGEEYTFTCKHKDGPREAGALMQVFLKNTPSDGYREHLDRKGITASRTDYWLCMATTASGPIPKSLVKP